LYTQCPDCSTVFRVTAEALRAAQGRVRCGICSSEFNALENLSESPVARSLDEAPHEDTITVEELPGNEFIELTGAADPMEDEPGNLASPDQDSPEQYSPDEDSPDEEAAAGDAAVPAEGGRDEGAAADPLDGLPDTALEFHGSAEDLERLFVPATGHEPGTGLAEADLPQAIEDIAARDLSGIEVQEQELSWQDEAGTSFDPGNPAHVAAVLASSAGEAERSARADLDRTDEYPVLVTEQYEAEREHEAGAGGEPGEETEAAPQAVGDEDEASAGPAGAAQDLEAGTSGTGSAEGDGAQQPDGIAGDASQDESPLLIIPEELRRGPSATAADDLAAPTGFEDEAPRRWPLAVAAALLAAVLGLQAVHHWRQDLVRSPAAGPWMLRAYHALGLDLQPPVDLGRFELRQLGAASDPGQAGRIRVRASIVNHAPFAQPYPLLRLTLQDRFGSTIGARNLGPTEYLPAAAVDASGLLGASQRADAEVVFVDPGREAVGFELDVCAEGESGLRCSADLPRNAP